MKQFATDWQKTCLFESGTIGNAIESLNNSGLLLCCIVDDRYKIMGAISDGTIRRAILGGAKLSDPIFPFASREPIICSEDFADEEIKALSIQAKKREIPIVNANGQMIDLFVLGLAENRVIHETRKPFSRKLLAKAPLENPIVILAGGLGTRLRPAVSDRPKPLAIVGTKPIIEIVSERAYSNGFRKFFIAVNYMGEMIEKHFEEEQYSGYEIEFVREKKRLGTAGALGLIKNSLVLDTLVTNADVLTNIHFDEVLKTHQSLNADITCVVRQYSTQIPFGVVTIENEVISSIQEKPSIDHFINAGIYVLSPKVCQLVNENEHLDMPDLVQKCMDLGMKVSPYLIHEYWLDVGKPEDYQKAVADFSNHFDGVFKGS